MNIFASVLLSSSLLLLYFVFSDAVDSITQSQFISDSNATTLISKDEVFALGSSVQVIPQTVTLEFGTTKSQLKHLFG